MVVRIASQMLSSSKEQLQHSVSQFLQPHPVRMAMQWVRERYSLRSLALGRNVLSPHPRTVVFAHLVGTNSSSSMGQPRPCHSGSALGAILASLAIGLTCQDSLNPASNLELTIGHFVLCFSFVFLDCHLYVALKATTFTYTNICMYHDGYECF